MPSATDRRRPARRTRGAVTPPAAGRTSTASRRRGRHRAVAAPTEQARSPRRFASGVHADHRCRPSCLGDQPPVSGPLGAVAGRRARPAGASSQVNAPGAGPATPAGRPAAGGTGGGSSRVLALPRPTVRPASASGGQGSQASGPPPTRAPGWRPTGSGPGTRPGRRGRPAVGRDDGVLQAELLARVEERGAPQGQQQHRRGPGPGLGPYRVRWRGRSWLDSTQVGQAPIGPSSSSTSSMRCRHAAASQGLNMGLKLKARCSSGAAGGAVVGGDLSRLGQEHLARPSSAAEVGPAVEHRSAGRRGWDGSRAGR